MIEWHADKYTSTMSTNVKNDTREHDHEDAIRANETRTRNTRRVTQAEHRTHWHWGLAQHKRRSCPTRSTSLAIGSRAVGGASSASRCTHSRTRTGQRSNLGRFVPRSTADTRISLRSSGSPRAEARARPASARRYRIARWRRLGARLAEGDNCSAPQSWWSWTSRSR